MSLKTIYATGATTFVLATASSFAWILAVEQMPVKISTFLLGFSSSPVVILLMINVILLLSGMFINVTSSILIFTPIFYPLIGFLGISPIHLGTIIVFNLMIGLLTPPVGMGLYFTSKIFKIPVEIVLKNLMPYFIVLIIVLMAVTFFPPLSTWLPGLLFR